LGNKVSRLDAGGSRLVKAAFLRVASQRNGALQRNDASQEGGAFQESGVSRLGTVGSRHSEVRVSENRVSRRKDSRLGRLPKSTRIAAFPRRVRFQGISRLMTWSSRLIESKTEQILSFEDCVSKG